jgi:phenylacetate-coenzyme A ligase PaaK-like adenylate-forming protein
MNGKTRIDRLRDVLVSSLRSTHYARAFGDLDLVGSDEFEILSRLPILDRTTAQSYGRAPVGGLVCVPAHSFVRAHHTSGSTGSGSLWVYDTQADWDAIVDGWERALALYEIGEHDRALVCASYGRFIGFWGLHEALIRRGVMTISGADLDTVGRADLIERLGVTVVAATPSYALVLGRETRTREHAVRLVLTSGESRPAATRRRLEETWRSSTADTAGMTEIGTISMVECPDQPGDLHVLDAVAIEEVLHAETREPVPDGELGVRVVTPLTRRGMPFIRYWTNDLVVAAEPRCRCGVGSKVYVGGIRGRLDDMVKIRGVWFLPTMLDELVSTYREVGEYRSTLTTDERGLAQLKIQLELAGELHGTELRDFESLFAAECKRALGFRPEVEVVESGALPRPEGGKIKRFFRDDQMAQAGMVA